MQFALILEKNFGLSTSRKHVSQGIGGYKSARLVSKLSWKKGLQLQRVVCRVVESARGWRQLGPELDRWRTQRGGKLALVDSWCARRVQAGYSCRARPTQKSVGTRW